MEKISVIIPVLNENKHLKKLLPSLKEQGVDVQVIIADAGSTDGSIEIAKQSGAKVVKGGLPGPGRNRGEKHAKHERIVFLDADVTLSKNFLKNCIEKMDAKSLEVAGVHTSPDSNKFSHKLLFGAWDFWTIIMQKISPHAAGYCIFSSRRVHKKIQGFDERIRLGEDANYVLRASKIAKFGIISESIGVSTRRIETEGALGMSLKMLACGLRRLIIGEDTKNSFKYEFHHDSK